MKYWQRLTIAEAIKLVNMQFSSKIPFSETQLKIQREDDKANKVKRSSFSFLESIGKININNKTNSLIVDALNKAKPHTLIIDGRYV